MVKQNHQGFVYIVSKHDERDFTWKLFDHVAFELMFVFVVERDKFSPNWFIRCWCHIVSNRIWLVFFFASLNVSREAIYQPKQTN